MCVFFGGEGCYFFFFFQLWVSLLPWWTPPELSTITTFVCVRTIKAFPLTALSALLLRKLSVTRSCCSWLQPWSRPSFLHLFYLWCVISHRTRTRTLTHCLSGVVIHTSQTEADMSASSSLRIDSPTMNWLAENSSGQRYFSYEVLAFRNQLPVSDRHSASVSSFKCSLKTFLFSKTLSSVRAIVFLLRLSLSFSLCMRARVYCMHCILKTCTFKESVSSYGSCGLGIQLMIDFVIRISFCWLYLRLFCLAGQKCAFRLFF